MIIVSFSKEKIQSPALTMAPLSHLASCTPTKSNLYLAQLPGSCCNWTWPIQAPYLPTTKSHVSFPLLKSYQRISSGLRHIYLFRHKASFYGEELLAPRPTPKLEDHRLPAVRNCLFNIFVVTLHTGYRSFNHNLRTRHAVVTGTYYSWPFTLYQM